MNPGLLTIPQAAEWLGIPEGNLRKQVSARLVPHRRIGKHVRFAQEDLDLIVATHQVDAVDPSALAAAARSRRRRLHSTA